MRIARPCFVSPLAALLLALAFPASALAEAAPRLAETSFSALAKPLPYPYDERADAHAAIAQAKARARAGNKLLLIDMGANWCPDCRILAGTMVLPDLAPFLRANFEIVTVDVGRFERNMDIAVDLHAHRLTGIPAVLVVDPESGKLLNPGRETALSDARSFSPQVLADWLAGWTAYRH